MRDSFISTYKLNNWSCSQSLFWWFLKHDFIFKLKIPKSPSGISSVTNMCSPNCYLERVSGWKQFQLDFVGTVVSSELFGLEVIKQNSFFSVAMQPLCRCKWRLEDFLLHYLKNSTQLVWEFIEEEVIFFIPQWLQH